MWPTRGSRLDHRQAGLAALLDGMGSRRTPTVGGQTQLHDGEGRRDPVDDGDEALHVGRGKVSWWCERGLLLKPRRTVISSWRPGLGAGLQGEGEESRSEFLKSGVLQRL